MTGQNILSIPEEWDSSTLGNIASDFVSGGTPSTKNPNFWQGDIPWITSKWIDSGLYLTSGEKFISQKGVNQSSTKVVPKNNLIFATRVGVGKVAINTIDLAINQDLAGIIIDSRNIEPPFLAYQLRTDAVQKHVELHKRGATIKGITRDNLKDVSLFIPPLPEQKKIAHVLSTVQRAIEQQEQIIALTTELKKSLMHKLFTEGTHGEPQKQTEIGPVPESWEMRRLGDVFDTQLGKMLSKKARTGQYSCPYLRNANVQWGYIDTSDLLEMDFNERERLKFELKKNDLLVCEGGQPGRAAIWNGQVKNCYYQKALHRLRPKDNSMTNAFLLFWLWYSIGIQNIYGVSGASSTIAHLPAAQLKSLMIPVPLRDEQDAITAAIEAVVAKQTVHEMNIECYRDFFRTLLHQLMTAQIRVDDVDLSPDIGHTEPKEAVPV